MNEVAKAIEILKNGGIVIFPTDTAFGIGCRIDNEETVEKLFKIRLGFKRGNRAAFECGNPVYLQYFFF